MMNIVRSTFVYWILTFNRIAEDNVKCFTKFQTKVLLVKLKLCVQTFFIPFAATPAELAGENSSDIQGVCLCPEEQNMMLPCPRSLLWPSRTVHRSQKQQPSSEVCRDTYTQINVTRLLGGGDYSLKGQQIYIFGPCNFKSVFLIPEKVGELSP